MMCESLLAEQRPFPLYWCKARLGKCMRSCVFKAFLICALVALGAGSQAASGDGAATTTFPRLMGLNIGAKNYQDGLVAIQESAR